VEAQHKPASAVVRCLLLGDWWDLPVYQQRQRGCFKKLEQLNIVGKRSGEGFVSHKSTMVNTLSRGLAERLLLMDFTIGRKGLLGYIKALAGSNIVKIVPASNGSASEERAVDKRLKVVCGAFTTYLDDMAWIGEKTSYSLAEVRISPNISVKPNIGSLELSEAISRVLPFTATEDNRPVLQCVLFEASEGKLKLVSADGFRLAVVTLDSDEGEGKVLVNRDDLKGIASALRKAKRVRVTFDKAGESLDGMALFIDTEVARYKFVGVDGQFPDYEPLIPTEHTCHAHLDTLEAVKAVHALKATSDNPKSYPVDLTIGGGHMIMANPDEKGEVIVKADSGDEFAYIRIDGSYFADVMRAFGGMVDFSLSNPYSPMLFSADGFDVVVMPMMSNRASEQQRADSEAKKAEAEPTTEADSEPTAEVEVEDIAEAKPRRSRSRKKEPVAVA